MQILIQYKQPLQTKKQTNKWGREEKTMESDTLNPNTHNLKQTEKQINKSLTSHKHKVLKKWPDQRELAHTKETQKNGKFKQFLWTLKVGRRMKEIIKYKRRLDWENSMQTRLLFFLVKLAVIITNNSKKKWFEKT